MDADLLPCHLCDAGFPLSAEGWHYGSQSKGMIPNTRCRRAPAPSAMATGERVYGPTAEDRARLRTSTALYAALAAAAPAERGE